MATRDVSLANAAADAGAGQLNGGTINVYSGTVPADQGSPITVQILVCACALSPIAANAASGGDASFNPITTGVASAIVGTQNMSFLRILDASGVARIQATIGTSGTDIIVGSVAVIAGQQIVFDSLDLVERFASC